PAEEQAPPPAPEEAAVGVAAAGPTAGAARLGLPRRLAAAARRRLGARRGPGGGSGAGRGAALAGGGASLGHRGGRGGWPRGRVATVGPDPARSAAGRASRGLSPSPARTTWPGGSSCTRGTPRPRRRRGGADPWPAWTARPCG